MPSFWPPRLAFLCWPLPTFRFVTVCKGPPMFIDYILGGIVTVGLLAYLVYALVRPERF